MKIKISNKNGIIRSAFIEMTELALSIFINTEEKNIVHDLYTFAKNYIEFFFLLNPGSGVYNYDKVKVIAENEEDIKMLDRKIFESHNKDQLWYILIDEGVYTNSTQGIK